MNNLDHQYINLCKKILNEGVTKTDRTGTGTLSLFAEEIRHDLSKGFPILTTKSVHFKSVVGELLWFISGSSNERDLAEITHGTRGVENKTIWSPNAIDMGRKNPERFNGFNVGNMYGAFWRYSLCNPHSYQTIPRRTYVDDYVIIHEKPSMNKVYPNPIVRKSVQCGNFTTLGKQGDKFVVMFHDTGSYRLINTITKGLKDLFKPSVEGVGYVGGDVVRNSTTIKLRRIWQDILIRVYNPRDNHTNYEDVKVCSRWLSLSNFIEDCYGLLGFQEFIDSNYQWQLDKNYWGSSIYSPKTCLFLSPEINKMLNGGGEGFTVYKHDSKVFYSRRAMQEYRGYTRAAYLPDDLDMLKDTETHINRPIIYIDQIASLVKEIKTNPDSRRLVVSAWNDRGTENAILSMCHPMFQCYVNDGKLSLMFNMRSCDVFLGLPFNIASYALLTHMLAQVTNLEVGELIWRGGDAHIYQNHIEQVKTQIQRYKDGEVYDFPSIGLDSLIKDIDDFDFDDITLIDYKHAGKLTGKMAV